MNRMQESVDGSWQDKARARFAADVISAALSPTNYLGTNPAALREAVATGGLSLARAPRTCCGIMARGGMPSMVDRKQFKVGKDLAATPGPWCTGMRCSSCCSTAPTTPKVRAIPC
jgi:Poly(3-hydroxyalkanoate) synthetase